MTDVVFATRIWTKLPTAVAKIPRLQVIGHAIGNLMVDEGVVKKFKENLNKMVARGQISEDTAIRVEYSRFTMELLAYDFDHEGQIDEKAIVSVIQESIKKTKDHLSSKIYIKVEEGLKNSATEIMELKKQISELQSVTIEKNNLITQVESLSIKQNTLETQLESSKLIADLLSSVISYIIIFFVWLGFIFTLLRDNNILNDIFDQNDYKIRSIIVITSVFGTLLTHFGISYIGIRPMISGYIQRYVRKFLLRASCNKET